MVNKLKKLINRVIYKLAKIMLSSEKFTKFHFFNQHKYKLNLSNPKSFNEKVQWIKYFGELELLANYVDKYEVRQYVINKIGKEYLIPLIGVFGHANEIDLSRLPKSFVIKATHASGWNIIVQDKNTLDWEMKKGIINQWVSSSFYQITGERNYKLIKGRVVVEEFLEDPSGDLKDYKIFCFSGEPKFIQVDACRYKGHQRDLYDINWNKLSVSYGHENIEKSIEKPNRLKDLLEIARKLSEDFTFVRVDLYYTNERIYFGELTFTPCQGFEKFTPTQFDFDLGANWIIENQSLLK